MKIQIVFTSVDCPASNGLNERINQSGWKQLVLDEVFVIGYSTLAFLVVS